MTRDELALHLARTVSPDQLKQFRPVRSAIVLPILHALVGSLQGQRVIELGSGEPLLLAKALLREGARVTAVDPALADPRVTAEGVELVVADLFELATDALEPADITLSTLLFGAPLRQRVRRQLWPQYIRGERPSEAMVLERLRALELGLLDQLAAWTRPGGWTLHWSLERLFAATEQDWRERGFDVLSFANPSGDAGVLDGMVIARRR